MAAVLATVRLMREQEVPVRAARLGARVLDLGRRAASEAAAGAVRDVRGRGLLIGVEFSHTGYSATFTEALLRAGVIPTSSLGADNVVRLTPPALLTDADLAWRDPACREPFAALSPAETTAAPAAR